MARIRTNGERAREKEARLPLLAGVARAAVLPRTAAVAVAARLAAWPCSTLKAVGFGEARPWLPARSDGASRYQPLHADHTSRYQPVVSGPGHPSEATASG